MSDSDFEEADKEAEVVEVVELQPPESIGSEDAALVTRENNLPANVIEFRERLVKDYHKGAPSLVAKLKKTGREDHEALLVALIDEIVQETEHLLGNQLVATQNGELRDASIISFKRAEVLEKAIKAVQSKQDAAKEGGINVDSPQMMVVIRFFMGKAHDAFDQMGVGDEVGDLFFRVFGEIMDDWKRELKEKFEELRLQG